MPVAEATDRRRAPNPTYQANVREYARRLHTELGYSTHRIRKSIQGLGYNPPPSHSTIRCWIDDEYREERLRRRRSYVHVRPERKRGWRLRLERMEELRHIGLGWQDVARVMKLDFGLDLSRDQVRLYVGRGVSDRIIKRRLYPERAQS